MKPFTRKTAAPWALLFLLACTGLSFTDLEAAPYAGISTLKTLPDSRQPQRIAYQKAVYSLNTGRIREFQRAKKTLKDYPLYPYLEYYDLQRNLNRLKYATVTDFRQNWPDSPLSDRLFRSWLLSIAKRGDWKKYLKYYQPTAEARLRCYYLRALYRTGEKTASMAGVRNLWLTPKSQPKPCDPLFATWIENGHLTTGIAWQRLIIALEARQRKLARFLLRYFDGKWKSAADTLYQVHRRPELLANHGNFKADQNLNRDIIRIGLIRWADKDPAAATAAWQGYRISHSFTAREAAYIHQALQIQAANHDLTESIQTVTPSPDGRHLLLLEALSLSEIRQARWTRVEKWISQMPHYEQIRPRWLYWRGRAALALAKQQQTGPNDFSSDAAITDLGRLARQRNYYGFMAADLLGLPSRLNHNRNQPDPESHARMQQNPAVTRALELYAVNDLTNARREWYRLSEQISLQELAAAANLAAEVGWIDQSIRTANAADLHDALELRFPTPWELTFRKESYASGLPTALIYAIARQESAFEATALSSADARGLMQLLPSTASITARRMGLKAPSRSDLYRPEVNVKLGAQYLASLLLRFGGTTQHALAAYNAGPFRVNRWLQELPSSDPDIWVEAIPYRETRNYVKNVMAFYRVYEQRLQPLPPTNAGYRTSVFRASGFGDSAEQTGNQKASPDLQSFPLH